jgi:hypothetical protein
MRLLYIGTSLILISTAALVLLLHDDILQLKEFLMLLIPAYLIVIVPILGRILARSKTRQIEKPRSRTILGRIGLSIISIIFVLDIAGVFLVYAYSRDRSFNDWPDGHWVADNPEDLFASADNIPVQNVKAVEEARRILIPLRPYIIDSSEAHDISPEAVAAFILVNRMFRAGYPLFGFHSGLAHLCWDLGVFPQQRNMYDNSPLYATESGRWLLRTLPTHIRLQDRFTDFLGGIIVGGSSNTMGNMQIKASERRGFEEEKSIRGDNLWARFDIDVSRMSNRRINWLLLTDPRLDIEAGVAALRQSIDRLIPLQESGEIVSDADLSRLDLTDWFHIFSEISDELPPQGESRPIAIHDLTVHCPIEMEDISRLNYLEYYAIVIQSGVFSDN